VANSGIDVALTQNCRNNVESYKCWFVFIIFRA